MAGKFHDVSMCERFRVTEKGRDPYEVETTLQDTLRFEMTHGRAPVKSDNPLTKDMMALVWMGARRLEKTSESSVVGWLPSLERVEMFTADEDDEDEEGEEDVLADHGPFLETDPTR